MTSPIRGASSSNYHYSVASSPESSPPQQRQPAGLQPSAEFTGLERMSGRRRRPAEIFNVRFSTDNPAIHEVPREDRKPDIVLQEDTELSRRAGMLYGGYPKGLPSDVKKSIKKDYKLYNEYKDILKNKGYKS